MKRMRRSVAVLLGGALLVSALAGCSSGGQSGETTAAATTAAATTAATAVPEETTAVETTTAAGSTAAAEAETAEEKTYDEHVSFSAVTGYSYFNAESGMDYDTDLHKWITDKYNCDIDLWACSQSESGQKIPLWINSGTMPDMLICRGSFTYSGYYEYIDQGLLKPLPEDWKEKWPNIAKTIEGGGCEDLLTVDGRIYGIADVVYMNLSPELTKDGINPWAQSLYFRRDWADQVGMTDLGKNGIITLSELKEYLEKVKAAGLSEVLLGGNTGYINNVFYYGMGIDQKAFPEKENGFIWGPGEQNYIDMISTMQQWFQEGLIDPEYFNNTQDEFVEKFHNGQSAAIIRQPNPGTIAETVRAFEARGIEDAFENVFDFAELATDEGIPTITGDRNGMYVALFNPDTDDTTFERILDIWDYFCTVEGEISRARGIPGVQWEFAEDGSINQLDGNMEDHDKPGEFQFVGVRGEDYQMSEYDETPESIYRDRTIESLKIKNAGVVWAPSDNYDKFVSDNKSNYSVPISNKIAEIVVNGLDVESTWKAFVEENRPLWEPLLNELNETYYPN